MLLKSCPFLLLFIPCIHIKFWIFFTKPSGSDPHENRSKLYLNSVQVIIITLLDLRRLVLEHNLKQMNWIQGPNLQTMMLVPGLISSKMPFLHPLDLIADLSRLLYLKVKEMKYLTRYIFLTLINIDAMHSAPKGETKVVFQK